ncbi:MAG: hypothetical protein ACLFVO_27255 [Chloroflexaceae bacterium]
MTITLEEIQCLADQLTPPDQARLIAYLAQQLEVTTTPAPAPTPPEQTSTAAWNRWKAFREEMHQQYPDADLAALLEADRRERDASLRGQLGADDVHP